MTCEMDKSTNDILGANDTLNCGVFLNYFIYLFIRGHIHVPFFFFFISFFYTNIKKKHNYNINYRIIIIITNKDGT